MGAIVFVGVLVGAIVIYGALQSVCEMLAEIMYRLSSISTSLGFISQVMKKEYEQKNSKE